MKQRNFHLDVIRCIGIIYIIGLHFFHSTHFFDYVITGYAMQIGIILKNCFTSCVPIFLMLTGYLMNTRKLSVKHYTKIGKVLTLYGFACIAIWIFRTIHYNEIFTLKTIFNSFVSFEHYSWYIGMYVGLYAMIPFLNIMYHRLETRNNKLLLIGVLIYFTALPSLTNLFIPNFIPRNFESLYPLTYYFVGAFLSEYADDFKAKASTLFLLYFMIIFIGGTFVNLCVANKYYYDVCVFINYENILAVCSTFVLFLAILKCDFTRLPKPLHNLIETISTTSLQLFMVSYIFDTLIYEKLDLYYPAFEDKFMRLPIIISLVFLGSFMIALIIQLIYDNLKKAIVK